MGRKIPGKKHHGVKDPLKQQAARNYALKDKINAPPTNPDEQEMPKSVLEIARLMKDVEAGKFNRKKKRSRGSKNVIQFSGSGPLLPGMNQEDKILPVLRQGTGESEHRFLHRADTVANDLLNEARMEEKHNVQVRRNQRGQVKTVDAGVQSGRKPFKGLAKRKKPLVKAETDEKPGQRLSRKKRLKLKRRVKPTDETEEKRLNRRDDIVFGEVAHAPPKFSALPRGSSKVYKAGDKDLLAHRILSQAGEKKSPMEAAMAEKRRLEAVEAYRRLKKLKS